MEENKDILSAAVAANEAELPVRLDVNTGVLNKATEEYSDEQLKELQNLGEANMKQQIDMNSLTPKQILNMRPNKVIQQVRNYKKIGRNEQCPCGSGKKYKNCCLKEKKYEGYHNVGEGQTAVA